jgi:hypothetical protein
VTTLQSLVVSMPQKKSDTIPVEERITTSIKVPPSVWKEFKKLAIDKDKEVSVLLEETMREKLRDEATKKHA